MPTIDLTTVARPEPTDALDAAPRRIGLTLPELRHAATLAGGAPLPFQLAEATTGDVMESRLGPSPAATEDAAYRTALAQLPDPEASLSRRGLVVDGALEPGIAGALGLLATPAVAVDLTVVHAGVQVRAWHRQSGEAVATLATADGIVFELAWFPVGSWPAELTRAAALSEDLAVRASAVPAYLDVPYELADAAAEAMRTHRPDLLPVLLARHPDTVAGPDGPLAASDAQHALSALSSEAQGRLRALVAQVDDGTPAAVGVVSWTLLADGWHAVRPHRVDGAAHVEVRRVDPEQLATLLAPVLAEAAR